MFRYLPSSLREQRHVEPPKGPLVECAFGEVLESRVGR
jgi:hypothetical protein